MAANPTAAESAHTDANQQFSLVAVQGTLGTADVSGSARTVPLGADPLTGALYVNNLGASGGGGTQYSNGFNAGTPVGNVILGLNSTTVYAITALGPGDSPGNIHGIAVFGLDQSSGGYEPLSTDIDGKIRLASDGTVTSILKPKAAVPILAFGTSGTSAIGTLVTAGGVGTSIYVTSFSIDGDSTTLGTAEVILSFGTQTAGTAVLFRATLATLNDVAMQNYGAFPVGGGVTNLPLTYLINSGAGSVSWNVTYFVQ